MSQTPTSKLTAITGDESEPTLSAYDLLSTPTLELTDAQVEAIIVDLRKRRELYIKTGKADKVAKPKEKALPKPKADAEEKARNTALLLAQLKLSKDD